MNADYNHVHRLNLSFEPCINYIFPDRIACEMSLNQMLGTKEHIFKDIRLLPGLLFLPLLSRSSHYDVM